MTKMFGIRPPEEGQKRKKKQEVEEKKDENKSHGQQKERMLIQCSQKQCEKILFDTKKNKKGKELVWGLVELPSTSLIG